MKIVAGFFISSLGLGTIAFGQSNENIAELNTKSVSIGRGAAPVIDGQLNEADWTQATLIDDFYQIIPFEYSEPSEPMEIHIYYLSLIHI